jgi:hypothetical protein
VALSTHIRSYQISGLTIFTLNENGSGFWSRIQNWLLVQRALPVAFIWKQL